MLKLSFIFLWFTSSSDVDWTAPADVYPRLVPMLEFPEYRYDLLTGLITSAGSRTESLVSHIQLQRKAGPVPSIVLTRMLIACSYATRVSV